MTRRFALLATLVTVQAACHAATTHERRLEAEARQHESSSAPAGCTLLLGDRNVKAWQSHATDLPGMKTASRGFSTVLIGDLTRLADRIARPCRPKVVVVCCGEDDVVAGRRPSDIARDCKALCAKLRAAAPKAQILVLSIKPSFRLWSRWRQIQASNAAVRDACADEKSASYVDVASPMLDARGRPRRDIWQAGGLVMNAAGYKLWGQRLMPEIGQLNSRWAGTVNGFAARDARVANTRGLTLFTGSSSIAMWGGKLLRDMQGIPCINRGFGGSQISDVLLFFDKIVTPHDLKAIVLYCGENDVAAGKTPQRVFDDFQEFVRLCRDRKPGVPVYYISMKPSPSRWRIWPKFQQGNKLIEDYCRAEKGLTYVDVSAAMLGPDGKPKPDIWRGDKLHMNDAGYVIWTGIIRRALQAPRTP